MKPLAIRVHILAYLLVSVIVIFLNQRLNFDMHHDGLITTNFREIRFSIQEKSFWPFNQYGITWIIPYLPVILLGDPDLIFERANTISLLLLTLTLFISYITTRKILGAKKAIFVPLVLAATASLGNLRTWPSVSAMFYLSCFSLAAVSYFDKKESLNSTKRTSAYMGLLIPLIVFSRVQVGMFLLVVFSIAVLKFGRSKSRTYFFSAITLTTLILALILASRNWLGSVLSDTFVYSLNYLTKDDSRVLPLFTIIGSLSVLVFFSVLLSKRTIINYGRLLSIFAVFGLLILVVLYVKVSLTEDPNSLNFYRILLSRLFVSTLIGTFLYCLIDQIRDFTKKKVDSGVIQDLRTPALVLVAGASLLQLVPLFSSTHAWWASPPLLILLSLLINRVILKYFKIVRTKIVLKVVIFLSIALVLFSAQTYNLEKSQLTSFGSNFASGAISSEIDVSEQKYLSKKLSSIVPSNSKVLNLCINSNVFLIAKNYRSASRFYVSWPNMRRYKDFTDATGSSNPDFILTCSDLLNPPTGRLTEQDKSDLQMSQEAIIQQIFLRPNLVIQFASVRDIQWELWSNKA